VATNCCVVPSAIEEFVGVTAMLSSWAGPTAMVVWPTIPVTGSVAETVAVPVETAVALPPVVMLATARLPDAHITEAVRSCVVPFV
jgi:hypothetical protein